MTAPTQEVMEATGGDTRPPPSCLCKFCCPVCTVYNREGCGKACCCALICCEFYTVCCWKPSDKAMAGKKEAKAGGKEAKAGEKEAKAGKKEAKPAKAGKKGPAEKVEPMTDAGPKPANDLRMAVIGEDRRGFPGGMLDVKSCHFAEMDELLIPFVNIHNIFVDAYNSMACATESMKEVGATYSFNIELSDITERQEAAGWKDESSDFIGRVVAKDAIIQHSPAANGQIRDAKGNPLSQEAIRALEAKMPGLNAQLDVLLACGKQFDFYFTKKENLPAFKYGPFSLALRKVGGLSILQVLRLPPNIKGDAKPPMMPDLMALKYLDGGYPRQPNPELQIAVDKFNNASFEIRGILNSEVTVKGIVKDAISKLKVVHLDPTLIITVNGKEFDLAFLKTLTKLATGEALDKGEGAVKSGGVSLKDLKMPKIPTLDDIMQYGDGFLQKLTSGELDVDFALKPTLEEIMSEDPSSYLKDLPKKVREVINDIAGSHASSLKSQLKETFEFLKLLLDPDGEDVPEGKLSFEQQAGVQLPPWYTDREKVGKGSAVKYTQNLPKLFKKVPDIAKKMETKLQELINDPAKAVKPMNMGGNLPDKGVLGAKNLPKCIMQYGAGLPKIPSLATALLSAIGAVLLEVVEGFAEGASAAVKAIDGAQIKNAANAAVKSGVDGAKEQAIEGVQEEVTERIDEVRGDLMPRVQIQTDPSDKN